MISSIRVFADPLTADVARFCHGADDAGVQDAATGALGGLVDSDFRPCHPFMPFSEPHAAATGNLLPPSTAVLPSPGTIAAPAAALGAGADSSTDRGGAAVPKRQRSSGAKATLAEKARAKRLRVKELQSANDEELAALRLLCSKQAEELQQLPPDSRARCAEIASSSCSRDTAAGSSSSCDDDCDTGCTGRARQHRVSAAPTALRFARFQLGKESDGETD